jgi:hypothetical protein
LVEERRVRFAAFFDDIPAPVYKEEGDSGEQETGYHAHYRLEGKRPTTFTAFSHEASYR